MQTCFSEFQGKIILKRPKFETRCLAHASRIEALAIVLLGVHRGAFAQQQLRSRDVAVARRMVQRRFASGAFSREAVWPLWASAGTTGCRGRCSADDERKVWAAELYARSTHKRMMNVLDSTASNCAKKKTFTNTLNKFQYNITAEETMCSRKRTTNW